jgi:hypothetical protein
MKAKKKQKRPRGNPRIRELGQATRFRPGVSGNPGGRPSRTPYADAHRAVAQLAVRDLRVKQSDAVSLAVTKRTAREAIRGKISAASEAANRAEGSPRQSLEVREASDVNIHVVYDRAPIRNSSALSETAAAEKTNPKSRSQSF